MYKRSKSSDRNDSNVCALDHVIRKLFDDFLAFSAAEGAITFPWHMVREILDLAGLPTDRASNAQTIIQVIRTMRDRIRELNRARNEAREALSKLQGAQGPT